MSPLQYPKSKWLYVWSKLKCAKMRFICILVEFNVVLDVQTLVKCLIPGRLSYIKQQNIYNALMYVLG